LRRVRGNVDHFGTYVRSLSLHFFKKLFRRLEPMTSLSQGNSFTAASGLPFKVKLNCNAYFGLVKTNC
jgi:hypothetical protein